MKTVLFHPEADAEFIDATRYYERQAPGLGGIFLNEVLKAINVIQENPEMFKPIGSGVRRKVLHRFPYSLLYAIESEKILIVAMMHQKRRPNYWQARLELLRID